MSATEDLRRLLDERGVPWKEHRHVMPGSMAIQRETLWGQPTDVASGKLIPHVYHYRATEMGDGRLFLEAQLISPEQAIAATLGDSDATGERQRDVEMCHDKNGFDPDTGFECTVCGTMVDSYMVTPADTGHEMQFHYCPNCGRKVVADG